MSSMPLGYHGKLYILAFDHRGSFQKKMFGIQGAPTAEETATIADAKKVIFEGMLKAVERGVERAGARLVHAQGRGREPALQVVAGRRLGADHAEQHVLEAGQPRSRDVHRRSNSGTRTDRGRWVFTGSTGFL